MNVNLSDGSGTQSGTMEVADAVFGRDYNESLVHQVVVAYMAGARQGSKAQKTRSQVAGGGRKPWRQKGTGRARAGTIRSPIWRGGGKVFAAVPRSFEQKVNRKMYRAALTSILSELLRQERLVVVESLAITEPRTKAALQQLAAFDTRDALFITAEADANLSLATRNLPYVDAMSAAQIDPVSLLRHDKVIATREALEALQEKLSS